MLFQISDLTVHYQKVAALKGISLGLADGDIVTLIGANGAGKSTTLRAISGLAKPSSGEISFEGRRIDGMRPERIVALGIAHVPEGRRVFPGLTVLENLHTGAYLRRDSAAVASDLEKVFHHFPRLKERRSQFAKTLSGGEQQMLAIGRALMATPKVLLLDEPSMGLSPILTEQIFSIISEINTQGTTVLLVEQNALMALNAAHRGYVIQTGNIILADTAANLAANPQVRQAYLGEI